MADLLAVYGDSSFGKISGLRRRMPEGLPEDFEWDSDGRETHEESIKPIANETHLEPIVAEDSSKAAEDLSRTPRDAAMQTSLAGRNGTEPRFAPAPRSTLFQSAQTDPVDRYDMFGEPSFGDAIARRQRMPGGFDWGSDERKTREESIKPIPHEALIEATVPHAAGSAAMERTRLRDLVQKYGTNLTPKTPLPADSIAPEEALLNLLVDKAVTPEELDKLVEESYRRDAGRAIAFGAMNSLSRITDLGISEAIKARAPDSRANHVPIGSFVNGGMSTAVQTGGKSLGPRYHPEVRIPTRPYEPFGVNEGTISFDDPYYPVSAAHALGIGFSAVKGTKPLASFAISASFIVVGYMARGYKTFKNEEAIRTSGGNNMAQPWLDAADLTKTETAIDDLRRPRIQALTSYVGEIGGVLRHRPWPATKVAAYSPRSIAHTLSVLPGGIADAFGRTATDPISSLGWSVVANQLNVFALQHRLHIEHYVTAGVNKFLGTNWSHSGAVAKSGSDSTGQKTVQNVQQV